MLCKTLVNLGGALAMYFTGADRVIETHWMLNTGTMPYIGLPAIGGPQGGFKRFYFTAYM